MPGQAKRERGDKVAVFLQILDFSDLRGWRDKVFCLGSARVAMSNIQGERGLITDCLTSAELLSSSTLNKIPSAGGFVTASSPFRQQSSHSTIPRQSFLPRNHQLPS